MEPQNSSKIAPEDSRRRRWYRTPSTPTPCAPTNNTYNPYHTGSPQHRLHIPSSNFQCAPTNNTSLPSPSLHYQHPPPTTQANLYIGPCPHSNHFARQKMARDAVQAIELHPASLASTERRNQTAQLVVNVVGIGAPDGDQAQPLPAWHSAWQKIE